MDEHEVLLPKRRAQPRLEAGKVDSADDATLDTEAVARVPQCFSAAQQLRRVASASNGQEGLDLQRPRMGGVWNGEGAARGDRTAQASRTISSRGHAFFSQNCSVTSMMKTSTRPAVNDARPLETTVAS